MIRRIVFPALAVFLGLAALLVFPGLWTNRSSAAVLVKDSRTGRPLVGLVVEASGASAASVGSALAETDEAGRAVFANLRPELTTFRVSLLGFKDFFQTVRLSRGDNGEIVFLLELATASVRGRVLDAVAGEPLKGAVVTLGGVRDETDADGRFFLDEAIVGTPVLKVRKDGYEMLSMEVVLANDVAKDLGDLLVRPVDSGR